MTLRGSLVCGFGLAASVALGAQSPPPVNGVNGTVAMEGTTNEVYRALNIVIVQTRDGVEHIIRFTKNLVVHGGKSTGVDALQGLEEGSTVVVHYTQAGTDETAQEIDRVGDQGLEKTEGVVVLVDRRRRQITIRLANGVTESLQLTDRAAAEAGPYLNDASKDGTKVVVYYADEAGRKVAHYFKKVS